MKKKLMIFAAIAALAFSPSCQKSSTEGDGKLNAPVLSSDKTSVQINPESTDRAFTLQWTSASDKATYKLQIAAKDDSKFEEAEVLSVSALSKDFDQKSVADYAESFGLEDSYSLIFQVVASCSGYDEVLSNVIEIKVTEDAPAPALAVPVLAANKLEVIANPNNKEEAVSISWTSAAASGLTPSYVVEMGSSNSFDNVVSLPVEEGYMYVTLTGEYLAAYAEQYKLGEEFTSYIRVTASAKGAASVTSNIVSFDVSIDYEIPDELYIYFWEWIDPANAEKMEYQGDGIFTWTGNCGAWQFKFITTKENYWTGYFRDPNAAEYWTMKDGTKDECMFQLNDLGMAPGLYKVTVNCKTLKVNLEAQQEPLPEHLFLDFWAWGDATQAKEMTALGDGKFTWNGVIPRWEFKFTTSNATGDDYWTGYFRDPDATEYWTLKKTTTQVMFQLNDAVLLDGEYTINVDLNTLKVEMIPHIYPIGAFSWGWERGDAEEMTYVGDGLFRWTGALSTGVFKFLSQRDGDWMGYQRQDSAENYWTAVRCCDQEGDVMFDIESQSLTAGNYTIEFNPFTKNVVVTPFVD